jgi:signal transduction histidine kinase
MKRLRLAFPSGLEGKIVVFVFLGFALFFWLLYFGGLRAAQESMGQGLVGGLDSFLSWRRWASVLAGLGFAGVLALAWFAVRQMTTPMKRLISAAQRLARGDLETPIPTTGLGEAETLAEALETMRQRLHGAQQELKGWGDVLETRVKERTRELSTLYEVATILGSGQELGERLRQALARLVPTNSTLALVTLLDRKEQRLRVLATQGAREEGAQGLEIDLTDLPPALAQTIGQGKGTLIFTEPSLIPEKLKSLPLFQDKRTLVLIPLMAHQETLGSIILTGPHTLAFTAEEFRVLGTFASNTAMAIRHALSFEELKEKTEQLSATWEITKVLISSLKMEEGFRAFAGEVKRLVDLERAEAILDEGNGEITEMALDLVQGALEKEEEEITALKKAPLEWLKAHRKSHLILDLELEDHFPIDQVYAQRGYRSVLRLPLLARDTVVGYLALLSHRPHAFGLKETQVLEPVIAQLAVATENYRLFQGQGRYLERLTLLSELLTRLGSNLSLEEVVENVLRSAQQLLGGGEAIFSLYDPQTHELGSSSFLDSQGRFQFQASPRLNPSEATNRVVYLTGQPIVFPGSETPPLEAGAGSLIAVPVLLGTTPLGVLTLYFPHPHPFSQEDIQLLLTLGRAAAVAVHNARLFAQVGEIEALRHLSKLKTEFVSRVSHELRSPLTMLVGYSELLMKKEQVPTKLQPMVERIYDQARHMTSLVDDLLDISRIEAGTLELKLEEVDLNRLIETCVNDYQASCRKHSFATCLKETLPVEIDPPRISQVLRNLLSNAVKYSPTGGTIQVSSRKNGAGVIVSISDEGIGIPIEERERIFEKFYRGKGEQVGSVRGSGLGLSISKHLVEAHGGRIWLESQVGQGSTFFFSIPVRKGGKWAES